ncbi:hypothetical protein DAPPUDRAFT_111404 [Daphnia pulex]|uniref:C2H2-type domain-containing protein n=1 Tax=Daphnia pulex TaxID=6669 RepID=E9H924_DAPPU|nr:hypothetical protein DAPPUDRAFT_111404 [Daphnia pulex]|eukprot:EFX71714.1 hypothetical protein DAPPUDRAFT_111404 [Daphnia pulex]
MEIFGAANCFHFAETKVLEPKFTCRKPGCSADFTRSGNLYEHKRNVHQTISYPCVKCGLDFEHLIPLEENEQNVVMVDTLVQNVAVSMDKVNDDSRASNFTTNEEKRKKSLQRLKDAKRFKKLEKRNLPTVYSYDDIGDLTDSFSSQCSSHDSDDWSDWEDDFEDNWNEPWVNLDSSSSSETKD